jgi:ABC-2 type transport system ATP-binding protein
MTVAVRGEYAIRITNLTKRFGAFTAVDELSFDVPHGSVFGFLGPNGAGKTTTIGMMLGLVPPDGGTAEILGYDIRRSLPEVLSHTGAVVERPAFYPYLSGRQNLQIVASLRGIDDPTTVDRLLDTVGLTERADANFGGYSTGMRQRLGLASVLIGEPQLLILDEPTSGLDPAGQHEIRAFLKELPKAGRTVLISSHQLGEVQEVCSHVAIINRGKLVVAGPIGEIVGRGQRLEIGVDRPDAAIQLLRSMPGVDEARVEDGRVIVAANAELAGRINRALIEAHFDVHLLRPREDALEERFLELTSETAEGQPDGRA